ncbi:MAG TPA: hypothetical protein PKM25_05410, partial [Candidatus Ozemobacteraceae bacterium]|nr:hypothetical protein [Candidatus Ozemobacteraceae bacterium]
MFRRLLPLGLIALAAVVGLTGTAVAQVETNDSDVRESRGASALHDSQGVIGELINAVAEADLELRKCSLTATPAGGESLAELSVTASGVADVKRLIEGLRRKKQVLVEQLAMKPSAPTATPSAPVLFDLVLRLEPQEASPAAADALSRLAPFDGLPGFNLTEPALSGVHLYSCSIKASGPRSLQLVAPRLADLSELVRKEAGAAPASSKTISSSLIGAARVFTLDLSDDSAFLPVGDLLALFERLAKVCDPKEITVQMAPDGSRLLKMGIQAASARMADIGSLLASEERSIVIKADAVPAAVPD